jgi:hypothetical protein
MSTLSEHTFDDKACLTRRQVKDYLSAAMTPEEVAAVEQHFNSCPLCKEAMEGYLGHSDKALDVLAGLNNEVLNQHIGAIEQQMHEAKMMPILTKPSKRKKRAGQAPRLNSLVPIFALVGVFALFRYEQGNMPRTAYRPTRPTTAQEPAPARPALATAYAKPAPTPGANAISYPEEPVGRVTKVEVPVGIPGRDTSAHKPAMAGTMQPAKGLLPRDTAVVRRPVTSAVPPLAKSATPGLQPLPKPAATGNQPSIKRIQDSIAARKAVMSINQPPPKPITALKTTSAQPARLSKPAFGPAEYGHDTPVIRSATTPPTVSQEAKTTPKMGTQPVPASRPPKTNIPADTIGN